MPDRNRWNRDLPSRRPAASSGAAVTQPQERSESPTTVPGELVEAIATLADVWINESVEPAEDFAAVALAAIPDGWAKANGEWVRLSRDVWPMHDGDFTYYALASVPAATPGSEAEHAGAHDVTSGEVGQK